MSFDTDPREEQDAEMYAAFAAKDKRIAELEAQLSKSHQLVTDMQQLHEITARRIERDERLQLAAPAQPDTEALKAQPTDCEQLHSSMQFGSDMVSKYSAVCKELAAIKRVAECGSVTSFLSLSDDDKRKWFAIGIDESTRRKKADEQVEAQQARIAELEAEVTRLNEGWYKANGDLLDAQLAAQAGRKQKLPTNKELDRLWEKHGGHPADFAADALERWGGWPRGMLGQGGSLSAPPAPANAIDIVQAGAEFNSGCNDIGACGCAAPCDMPNALRTALENEGMSK